MNVKITEQNFHDFKCPHCSELNSFPDSSIGHLRQCFNCMEAVIVPETSGDIGKRIPLPIKTAQLILRRFGADDLNDLVEFYFDGDVEPGMQWLDSDRKLKFPAIEQVSFLAVEIASSKKVIAGVGLWFDDLEFLEAQVRIMEPPLPDNLELVSEAVDGVLKFCFEDLKLRRVTTSYSGENVACRRLYEGVGMRLEGEFLKDHLENGEWLDTFWFAMLAEEYFDHSNS